MFQKKAKKTDTGRQKNVGIRYHILLILLLAVLLCENSASGTNVGGPIEKDSTWALTNSPINVNSNVIIRQATLTIEAGVIVRFAPNTGLQVGDNAYRYTSGGDVHSWATLNAVGTQENNIIFTSLSGSSGDWNGIYFQKESDYEGHTSTMSYCVVEKAGQAGFGQSANIYCDRSGNQQPVMSHCTIRDATGYGVYLYQSPDSLNICIISSNTGGGVFCSGCGATITGCTFSNNGGYPLHFKSDQPVINTGNNYSGNGIEMIAIDGAGVESDKKWYYDGGEPYAVLGNVIMRDATLTVEPGVVVKFVSNIGLQLGDNTYAGLSGGMVHAWASLHAVGTVENKILFTSLSGNSGDWNGIFFQKESDEEGHTSTMSNCIVEKAGQNGFGQSANIYCDRSGSQQPVMSYCTIKDAAGYGIYLYQSPISINNCAIDANTGGGVLCSSCGATVTGCTFSSNNGYPLHFKADQPVINTGNNYSGNGIEMIAIDGAGVESDKKWYYDGGEPYAVLGNVIMRDATLTVEPGVVVKFAANIGLQLGDNTYAGLSGGGVHAWASLNAIGTPENNIFFTSLSGSSGDWNGIYFQKESDYEGHTSTMSYCVVEKAGQTGFGQSANIYCDQTIQPTITNCTIKDALGAGFYCNNSTSVLRGNLITNNQIGIYIASGTPPVLGTTADWGRNTIRDNSGYELYNNTSNAVSAEYNYWVALDASTIDSYIYDNDENASKGAVDYDPWLTTDAALPVELVSFTATLEHLNVTLRWTTATEKNNYGFEIERRKIGNINAALTNQQPTITNSQWSKVGFVFGSGTSNSPKEYSFTDKKPLPNHYTYRLKQIDQEGTYKYTEGVELEVGKVPNELTLSQNYPNPFNPMTTIEFTLVEDSKVSLIIYNTLGQKVATLVDQHLRAGVLYQTTFDAAKFSSGMYFYCLHAGSFSQSKKLVLLK